MKHLATLILLLAFCAAGCAHLHGDYTRITEISQLQDGSIKLVWRSRKSATYEILSSTDPDAAETDWCVELL
jgi:hypothetical protein